MERRIPALVTFGARAVPLDNIRLTGHAVTLIHDPDSKCLIWVEGATFKFRVTLDGLTNGLVSEHVEPYGRITITPTESGNGFGWEVIDIDGVDGRPNSQVWLDAEEVARFLVDLTLSRIMPVVPDVEVADWLRSRPRRHGGAA